MTTELSPTPPLPQRPRKSPGLAAFFSLLPGLGHVYVGLPQRGVAFLAAFLGCLWLVDHVDLSGMAVAFVFFYAMIDAYQMASTFAAEPGAAASPRVKKTGNFAAGLVLVLLGVLILYDNLYSLDLSFLADWWPVALILFGLWLLVSDLLTRRRRPPQEPQASSAF